MGKKKHLSLTAADSLSAPTPKTPIAKVLALPGQYLCALEIPVSSVEENLAKTLKSMPQWKEEGDKEEKEKSDSIVMLAQLPPKYRNVIWVKRGSYVMVDLNEQLTDKVCGEIMGVLLPNHIKEFKKNSLWPSGFGDNTQKATEPSPDSDDDLVANTNRVVHYDSESDEDSDDE
ncbi:putative RNA-binding protein eif1ad [Mycoemilia scoparia]|uniref:RNA-binding protein eif1ad n=1 Tax=Mycoemilia scoparia TaxID=417184 RepID=A0A9W8A1V6_9FUNG|nr:putative RNA-binding protein eif1ad [Mycoemilia scoparia]